MIFISQNFLKFCTTGALATLLHIAVAISLVNSHFTGAVFANAAAFVVSTGFSYACNTLWSFRGHINSQTILRFTLVTVIGLIFTLTLSFLTQYMEWHYGMGIAFSVLILPFLNYRLHRLFTYR